MDEIVFFSRINLHTIPHNDKAKTDLSKSEVLIALEQDFVLYRHHLFTTQTILL
jgi:hypothetical protein